MPNQDRTGPLGQGPLTGRGLGPCGRGLARGRLGGYRRGGAPCYGRGFRRNSAFIQPQVITETQEKELLKQELEAVKAEQAEIQERLKELK